MSNDPRQQSDTEGRARLRALLRRQSVRTGQTFTLASGKTSDFYVDVKKTSLDPEGAFWIGRGFAALLEEFADVKAIGGPTLGADPLTAATIVVGWTLGRRLDGFIVRKEPKGHGTGVWIEGPNLPTGTPVVVCEDVLTTGGSALKGCARVKEAGLDIRAVFAVVDREEGGVDALAAEGYAVRTLFRRHELV